MDLQIINGNLQPVNKYFYIKWNTGKKSQAQEYYMICLYNPLNLCLCTGISRETLESTDAVLIDCLNCGKKVALSQWHTHDSKCEGGASRSGSSRECIIHEGSTASSLNRGKKSYLSEGGDTCTQYSLKT